MSNLEHAKDLGKGIYTKEEINTKVDLNRMFEYDDVTRGFSNSWALCKTFSNFTKNVGTNVMLHWRVPFRNDSTGWGGGYIRIEYSLNNGASYSSLGVSGYDGGVMVSGSPSIGSNSGSFLIDLNSVRASEQIKLRFYHRAYDGTVTVNGSHHIEQGDLGAFWTNITMIEIG